MKKVPFLIIPSYTSDVFPYPPFIKFTIYRLVYGGKDGNTLKDKVPVANHRYLEEALKELRTHLILAGNVNYLETESILQSIQEADKRLEEYMEENLVPLLETSLKLKKEGKKLVKKRSVETDLFLWNEEKRRLIMEEEKRLKDMLLKIESFNNKKESLKPLKKVLKKKK